MISEGRLNRPSIISERWSVFFLLFVLVSLFYDLNEETGFAIFTNELFVFT
jgi:hypothetical protein